MAISLTTNWQQYWSYSYRYSSDYGYLNFYSYVRYQDISGSNDKKIQAYTKVVAAKNYRLKNFHVYFKLNNANQQSDTFSFKNAYDNNSWETDVKEWTVSYNSSGKWSGSVQSALQSDGDENTYVFNSDDDRWPFSISTSGSADIALPDLPKYTLTTNVNPSGAGTISSSAGSGPFLPGATTTLTANASSGYRFTSWSTGATTSSISVTFNGNVSVTANFVQRFTVTVNSNNSFGTVSGGGTFDKGSSVTVIASPKYNGIFLGWYNGSTLLTRSKSYTFNLNSNVSYTAMFCPTSVLQHKIA